MDAKKETLTIKISREAFRELLLLNRRDLPPKISIEIASQKHPFLKEILDRLHTAVCERHKSRETNIMWDAIYTLEKKENI